MRTSSLSGFRESASNPSCGRRLRAFSLHRLTMRVEMHAECDSQARILATIQKVRHAARRLRALGLLLGLGVCTSAQALTLDLSPFAEVGLVYERNLLRVETAEQAAAESPTGDSRTSDSHWRAAGGLTFELDHGRQSINLTGQLARSDYSHFTQLDHTAREGLFAWQWGVGAWLDGLLSWRAIRELDSFDNRDDAQPNFIVRREVRARGGVDVTPSWRAEIEWSGDRRENTLADRQAFDREERSLDLAWLYVSDPVLRVGLGFRTLDGEYLQRNQDDNPDLATRYDDRTFDVRATWQPSGISTLDVRLGRTRRDLEPVQDQGFDGTTGRIELRRTVSGKTRARLAVYRDLFSVEDVDANFLEDTGVRTEVEWAATSKLGLTLFAEYVDRAYEGGAVPTGEVQRREFTRAGGGTLRWQLLERLGLVLDLERDIERSNQEGESSAYWLASLMLRLGF